MKAVRLTRNLIVVIALVVSLGANVTLFVGGVLYSFVDKFVEEAFDLATAAGKQRKALTALKTSSAKQASALAALKKKNANLQTKNKRLQKQLTNVRKVAGSAAVESRSRLLRSASRSVATAPAKAVPVFGVLVVAGLTALEIKDLCETMSDMERIKRVVDAPEAEAKSEPATCPVPVPSPDQLLERIKGSAQEAWAESKKFIPDLPSREEIQRQWQDYWPDTWDRFKRFVP